ncbi:MAG: DNA primase [Pseudorhodobacter sp.]|nr:DNA primase [Rhizobacter sp.]
MIPSSFIQDLLTRVDIVDIVGRHVDLKKAGINHKGLCPFHGEKSPSFIVSATRQTYHCFGCGVHGNAVGFLMEHLGVGFPDAVRDLAQQAGMTVPEDDSSPEERALAATKKVRQTTLTETLAKANDHYRKQLKITPRAIDYLKARGLSGEIAATFGMGYAPDGWRALASAFPKYDDPLLQESGLVISPDEEGVSEEDRKRYDRFRDRIMFPIRSVQGEVIGFGGRVLDKGEPKYLNSPETPVFSKGKELYGLYEARQGLRQKGYALVVEGYMDVVALAQLGFPNAVATLGTACGAEHVQKLFRFTESIVFSFDGDAAGRRAAGRALEASLPFATDTRSIRFLFLPAEHDPDSYVRQLGAAAFDRLVEQAVPLSKQLTAAASEACDLGTAEGRARLLANAKPLWQALPDGAFKRQLLGELAKLAGLETGDVNELWNTSSVRSGAAVGTHPAASRAPWKSGNTTVKSTRGKSVRKPPNSPADQAMRMLMLHSAWWDELGTADHELLHALPAPLGELCAWLERQLAEHGTTPWAALSEGLVGHPLQEVLHSLVPDISLPDEMSLTDLQRTLNQLWIMKLGAESSRLIVQAQTDPNALKQWRLVDQDLQRRKALVIDAGTNK